MKRLDGNWHNYIKNGYRLFFGSGAACPHSLINKFLEHSGEFYNLEVVHILTLGETPWISTKLEEHIRCNSFFLGPGSRDGVQQGIADYTPCFLSEIPDLFKERTVPLDVAFIEVSPPDQHGYCSMGVSVDIVKSAAESANLVIAQVNDQMPRTYGSSFIHTSEIDAYIEVSEPITEVSLPELDPLSLQIGKYVSLLIEDGATLQMGIGNIPNAVLHSLTNHNDLGIHTEMFSDGLLDLYEAGNITNRFKGFNDDKTITSFCFGTKKLYDFVNCNPHVEFHPSEFTNSPANIAKNNKMVAINSAIQVDLTGQVVADSLGNRFYSGIGGQVDFIRGAGMSQGGRPIIAMPSTAKNGTLSKIVPSISEGSGVVTSRGDVHYVVTEYGIATLRGRSIRERAMELIQVAHPDFRDQLLEEVQKSFKVPSYQKHAPKIINELGDIGIKKIPLAGKKYYMRVLQPSDQQRLQDFFYSHTEQSLMQRYRYIPKNMSTERAYKLVNVDQTKDLALCMISLQGPRETIHGIGRFFMDPDGRAEIAFIVDEACQGSGIGTVLLDSLIEVATKREIKEIYAMVRSDNRPMRGILEKYEFEKHSTDDLMELMYTKKLSF